MKAFASALLQWFETARRDLPWRGSRTPYSVWVSEVMLQQTTAAVVSRRFPEFMAGFPDLESLARADEAEVVRAWQGLGYYRRARSLHAGAKFVMERFAGELPSSEAELKEIPGVGDYTASALRAFAFGQAAVAVDGNVARVLARLFAHAGEVGSARSRRELARRLEAEIPTENRAEFAEALIELGAMVCRPQNPDCGACPVREHCAGYAAGRARDFPALRVRPAAVDVVSHRALCSRAGRYLFVRREAGESLLPGFLEFPGRWGSRNDDPQSTIQDVMSAYGGVRAQVRGVRSEAKHTITKHRIQARLYDTSLVGPSDHPRLEWHRAASLPMSELTTETRKLLRGLESERGA